MTWNNTYMQYYLSNTRSVATLLGTPAQFLAIQ